MTKTIPASEVREGMQVSAIDLSGAAPWRKRENPEIRRVDGRWPVVTHNFPSVDEVTLCLSDDPGLYYLRSDTPVTVED